LALARRWGAAVTRDEHLACAKQRALELVALGDRNNLTRAISGFILDLGKHENLAAELRTRGAGVMSAPLYYAIAEDAAALRSWIEEY
jgi:hypothetical protein